MPNKRSSKEAEGSAQKNQRKSRMEAVHQKINVHAAITHKQDNISKKDTKIE